MLYNPRLPAPAAAVARKADARIAAWRIGFFGETSDSSCKAAVADRYCPCFERACKTRPGMLLLSTPSMLRAGRAAPLRGIGETLFSCNPSILTEKGISPKVSKVVFNISLEEP
jgi:hypothetical protein